MEDAYYLRHLVIWLIAGAVLAPLAGTDRRMLRLVLAATMMGLIILLRINAIDVSALFGRWLYGFVALFLVTAAIVGLALISARPILWTWFLIASLLLCIETGFRVFPRYDTLAANPGIAFFWPDWVKYPINNFGYRDREFVVPKPKGICRVLLLGDSFTEGAGLTRKQTFGRLIEKRLGRVEVYNLGHSGVNTAEEAAVLLRDGPALDPDVVILNYIPNDAETRPQEREYQIFPAWYVTAQRALTEQLGSYAAYSILGTIADFLPRNFDNGFEYYVFQHRLSGRGWAGVVGGFSELQHWAEPRSVPVIGVIWPVFNNEWKRFEGPIDDQVAAAMHEHGFRVLRLSGIFGDDLDVFGFSNVDRHPNARANEVVAKSLAEDVAPVCSSRARGNLQ
jgi:hypothetical protein